MVSYPAMVCRPALPKDTADVLEFTRRIWEGHDYVPIVWDEWLKDYRGFLAAAEYGGRVVGICKLTRLSEAEWWLEGLRVHPDYEGRGIASHLHDYVLAYWLRQRGEVLRLVTASSRKSVQHLCERSGFRLVFEATPYSTPAAGSTAGRFRRVRIEESNEALEFALNGTWPTFPHGLMDLGWQWGDPSPERFEGAVQSERAWWWVEAGRRRGLLLARDDEDEDEGETSLAAQLLACPVERLEACLGDFRSLAASLKLGRAVWFAPQGAGLEAIATAAGYQRDWEASLYCYEKKRA